MDIACSTGYPHFEHVRERACQSDFANLRRWELLPAISRRNAEREIFRALPVPDRTDVARLRCKLRNRIPPDGTAADDRASPEWLARFAGMPLRPPRLKHPRRATPPP